MEDKQLNEKESLELIAQMIHNTQQRLEKVHARPLLIFGYVTIIVSIAVWYMLKETLDPRWNFLWMAIPIVGGTLTFALMNKNKPKVRTFVDKTTDYVWLVCGSTVWAASFTPTLWQSVPILFIVALIISMATTLTGLITKVRLLVISGAIGILASFVLPSIKPLDSILLFAGIFLIMMVVPGHILYYKGKK